MSNEFDPTAVDRIGTNEYNSRMQEQAQQFQASEQLRVNAMGVPSAPPSTGTPAAGPKPAKVRRPRRFWSWAMVVTIPIGLLCLTISVHKTGGGSTALPLWERLVPTVLIAALGSPRLRFKAFILLVVAVAAWWLLG